MTEHVSEKEIRNIGRQRYRERFEEKKPNERMRVEKKPHMSQ